MLATHAKPAVPDPRVAPASVLGGNPSHRPSSPSPSISLPPPPSHSATGQRPAGVGGGGDLAPLLAVGVRSGTAQRGTTLGWAGPSGAAEGVLGGGGSAWRRCSCGFRPLQRAAAVASLAAARVPGGGLAAWRGGAPARIRRRAGGLGTVQWCCLRGGCGLGPWTPIRSGSGGAGVWAMTAGEAWDSSGLVGL